jgi:hypothetical protein
VKTARAGEVDQVTLVKYVSDPDIVVAISRNFSNIWSTWSSAGFASERGKNAPSPLQRMI